MKKVIQQKGAVSIFIVIFSALLIIIITTSFVRLMLQGQQQSTASDLSKSALDSAYAGVEDAKRALIKYQELCPTTNSSPDCGVWYGKMDGAQCDAVKTILGNSATGETQVGETALNQAYTCAQIQLKTDDFIGTLSPDASKIIPLKAEGDYNTVGIQWFSQSDLDLANIKTTVLDNLVTLPEKSNWSERTPSLVRAQVLQLGSGFNINDFNTNTYSSTVFLRPNRAGSATVDLGSVAYSSNMTPPRYPLSTEYPQRVSCDNTFRVGHPSLTYGCNVKLQLPSVSGGRKDGYLRLLAPYNKQTTFRVTLFNGSSPVKFDGAQPIVDSTGRTSDLFRRVKTRLEPQNNFPFVDAALDVQGDLCKNFKVGSTTREFEDLGGCNRD